MEEELMSGVTLECKCNQGCGRAMEIHPYRSPEGDMKLSFQFGEETFFINRRQTYHLLEALKIMLRDMKGEELT